MVSPLIIFKEKAFPVVVIDNITFIAGAEFGKVNFSLGPLRLNF
jgi:hypothetical protein